MTRLFEAVHKKSWNGTVVGEHDCSSTLSEMPPSSRSTEFGVSKGADEREHSNAYGLDKGSAKEIDRDDGGDCCRDHREGDDILQGQRP